MRSKHKTNNLYKTNQTQQKHKLGYINADDFRLQSLPGQKSIQKMRLANEPVPQPRFD